MKTQTHRTSLLRQIPTLNISTKRTLPNLEIVSRTPCRVETYAAVCYGMSTINAFILERRDSQSYV